MGVVSNVRTFLGVFLFLLFAASSIFSLSALSFLFLRSSYSWKSDIFRVSLDNFWDSILFYTRDGGRGHSHNKDGA